MMRSISGAGLVPIGRRGAPIQQRRVILRKVGRPLDIANAIAFLCSYEADFITGHALVVDRGLTIQLQDSFGVRQAEYLNAHPDTELPS